MPKWAASRCGPACSVENAAEFGVAGVQQPGQQFQPIRLGEVVVGASGGVLGPLELHHTAQRVLVDHVGREPDRPEVALRLGGAPARLSHVVLAAARRAAEVPVEPAGGVQERRRTAGLHPGREVWAGFEEMVEGKAANPISQQLQRRES